MTYRPFVLYVGLALSLMAGAQSPFYTIQNKPKLSKVRVVEDDGPITNDIQQQTAPMVEPSSKASTQEVAVEIPDSIMESKEKLVQAYLSVSPPIKGELTVTSPYGMRLDPIKGKKMKMHPGLDLRSDTAQVLSMMPGKVTKMGADKRSGIWVYVESGDIGISYCHLSSIAVQKGQWVNAGEVLAISGSTGSVTGPHLHITTKHKGKIIDPQIVLNFIVNTRRDILSQLQAMN